jgi:hypothetical protein
MGYYKDRFVEYRFFNSKIFNLTKCENPTSIRRVYHKLAPQLGFTTVHRMSVDEEVLVPPYFKKYFKNKKTIRKTDLLNFLLENSVKADHVFNMDID